MNVVYMQCSKPWYDALWISENTEFNLNIARFTRMVTEVIGKTKKTRTERLGILQCRTMREKRKKERGGVLFVSPYIVISGCESTKALIGWRTLGGNRRGENSISFSVLWGPGCIQHTCSDDDVRLLSLTRAIVIARVHVKWPCLRQVVGDPVVRVIIAESRRGPNASWKIWTPDSWLCFWWTSGIRLSDKKTGCRRSFARSCG